MYCANLGVGCRGANISRMASDTLVRLRGWPCPSLPCTTLVSSLGSSISPQEGQSKKRSVDSAGDEKRLGVGRILRLF